MARTTSTLVAATLLALPAAAQCTTSWLPGDPLAGTSWIVGALAFHDPDGNGPAPRLLVLGGSFEIAGDVFANGLATFDPATGSWATFGVGVGSGGTISDLLTRPGGELVAGGEFTSIGGTGANNVASWNGSTWSPLGTGTNGRVITLARLHNGDLLAGGAFTSAGGAAAGGIARWDGAAWHALGTGFGGTVFSVAVRPNGNVVAAGSDGATLQGRVAEWDGTTWNAIPPPAHPFFQLYTVAVLPGGDVVVGGWFTFAGLLDNVARWDGATWSDVGGGLSLPVSELTVLPDGDLLAGGQFDGAVARFDGSAWVPLTSGPGITRAIGAGGPHPFVGEFAIGGNGDLYCGGRFGAAGGLPASNVARFDGSDWHALAAGTSADIQTVDSHGDRLVVGGSFSAIAGVPAANIAMFDGSSWSALGGGVQGGVFATASLPGGDLLVGGNFQGAGSTNAVNIARWDGSSWHPIPGASPNIVLDLLVTPAGDVFVGAGEVHHWDGTTWSTLPGATGAAFDLLLLDNGDLLAAGSFFVQQSIVEIARWDGSQWHAFADFAGGAPTTIVNALQRLQNGDLVAGGKFQSAGGVAARNVARWDGTAWHPLGAGLPDRAWRLALLPSGELVASEFGGFPDFLVRWDGNAWQPSGGPRGTVYDLLLRPDGALVAGGEFVTAGGNVAAHVARWQPSCGSTVTSLAPACASTGGPMDLRVTQRPWVGGALAARCTGMAPLAIAAAVLGFTTSHLPLTANCTLVPTPDATLLLVPSGGRVELAVPIGAAAALGGLPLHVQIVQVEYDALGNVVAINASNALAATIGAY